MSSTAVAVQKPTMAAKIEQVLIRGDLATLNEVERVQYYNSVCESIGLNSLTRPFDYIVLNGKLVLYANKGCGEQLRSVYHISIKITSRETIEGVYVVTAAAQKKDGRIDESTGAVSIAGLKGDMLANAMLKAETKAKRRVTLSICGLNMLDETEVESIPPSKGNGVFASQPVAGDGVIGTKQGVYVIPAGKFARYTIPEIPVEDLRADLEARQLKTTHEDWEHQYMDRVGEYLESVKQMGPVEHEETPPGEATSCESCGSMNVMVSQYDQNILFCKSCKAKNKRFTHAPA